MIKKIILLVTFIISLVIYEPFAMANNTLWFIATYDKQGTLTLERTDKKVLSIYKVMLTALYQKSAALGPEIGNSFSLDPIANYYDNGRKIVIRNADVKACRDEPLIICLDSLESIVLDFYYEGKKYSIVTNVNK